MQKSRMDAPFQQKMSPMFSSEAFWIPGRWDFFFLCTFFLRFLVCENWKVTVTERKHGTYVLGIKTRWQQILGSSFCCGVMIYSDLPAVNLVFVFFLGAVA